MKRSEQLGSSYNGHNYVTVIPVDYHQQPESPAAAGRRGGEDTRHLDVHHQQAWYNRPPGARFSVSSIQSGEWPSRNERAHAPPPAKKREVCVFLMNKVGLCLEVDNGREVMAQDLLDMIFLDEQEIALPPVARDIFCLWMVSPLLELQLKPHHKPFQLRQQWTGMLQKYTFSTQKQVEEDEPVLTFQRNVFFNKKEEMRISDMKILELLYEEAKNNVLEGRYVCDSEDCEVLAGIQAKLELGAFNRDLHTPDFFKNRITDFLPNHASKTSWTLFGFGSKLGAEHRLLEQYRSIPLKTSTYKLLRKYLEFCWTLPCYGSAFFCGQVEKSVSGLAILIDHHDLKVLVAINREGVHIIDQDEQSLIVSLRYQEFSWNFACPSQPNNADCLPCLFIQFKLSGNRESQLIQIFSKQAHMMNTLISAFVDELKQRSSWNEVEVDHIGMSLTFQDDDDFGTQITPRKVRSEATLEKQLKKLSLTSFNDAGDCVKRTGSFSVRK